MNKINQTLWDDYKKVSEKIEQLDVGSEHYEMLLEERDKLRNELLKFEQANMETNLKKGQMEAEDKREKTRNKITMITFAVTTSISMFAIIKTFRFDQDNTVTSTLGRNILNGVIPKAFKR